MDTTKSEQDKKIKQILTEEFGSHDSFSLSNVDNLSDLLFKMMKVSYEAGANAVEKASDPEVRLKRIVSGTASEIAEKKLFEFMGKEGMDIEEAEWTGCPKWIEEAMHEYARQKCKEQREICLNEWSKVDEWEEGNAIEDAPEPEFD